MLESIVRFVLRFAGSDPVLFILFLPRLILKVGFRSLANLYIVRPRLILKAGFAGLVNLFIYGVAF